MTCWLLSFFLLLYITKVYAFACDGSIIYPNNQPNSSVCSSELQQSYPSDPKDSSQYPLNTNCTLKLPLNIDKLLILNITFNPGSGDSLTFFDEKDTFFLNSSTAGSKTYFFTTTVTFNLKAISNVHGTLRLDWTCNNIYLTNSSSYECPYNDDYRIITFDASELNYPLSATINEASAPFALTLAYQSEPDVNTPMFFYEGDHSMTGAYLGRYSTLLADLPFVYNKTLTIVVVPQMWQGPNIFIILLKFWSEIQNYKFYRFYAYDDYSCHPRIPIMTIPSNIIIDATNGPAAAVVYQTMAITKAISNDLKTLDWYTETDGSQTHDSQPIFSFSAEDLADFEANPLPIIGNVNTFVLEQGSVSLSTTQINKTQDISGISYPAQEVTILEPKGVGYLASCNYGSHTTSDLKPSHYTNCSYSLPTLSNVNFTVLFCENNKTFQLYNGADSWLKQGESLTLYAIDSFQLSYPDVAERCKIQFTLEKYNISGYIEVQGKSSVLLFYFVLLLCLFQ